MKKTVTVNLDKTIFNIDDDAYTVHCSGGNAIPTSFPP